LSGLIATMADQVPRAHGWHRTGPLANTFYGGLIAVATVLIARSGRSRYPARLTRVELVAHLDAVRIGRPGQVISTTGTVDDRSSMSRTLFKLDLAKANVSLLEAATFLSFDPDLSGVLVPDECVEWARKLDFQLKRGSFGPIGTRFQITSNLAGRDSSARVPRHIRQYFNAAPIAQACAVVDVIDELVWFPAA
jgi:hypothetical protein